MVKFEIEIQIGGTDRLFSLRYTTKDEAMTAWDRHVENATSGDTLRLINRETDRIVSQYTPL